MTTYLPLRPIHPFPARMAPEIALEESASLPRGSIILDPMVGSGTVVRVASEHGHICLGFDMDPLAVLMTKVWTTQINIDRLCDVARQVARKAEAMPLADAILPWMDDDQETSNFIDYWFGKTQQADLRRLSKVLSHMRGPIKNVLRIALSRIIITKKRGASLAWDVSHSRPHRVRDENGFPVIKEFLHSVSYLAKRLKEHPPPGNVNVNVGDARKLNGVTSSSIDAVITSPPYLNAIDYLRGHKLALVWFGYRCSELRTVRSVSIGSGRSPNQGDDISSAKAIISSMAEVAYLPRQEGQILVRYVVDLFKMIGELYRVLRPGGKVVLVVGNSCIKGIFVENAQAVSTVAESIGFQFISRHERQLPPSRRYLPPPADTDVSNLKKRMRKETVLTFIRP